MAYSISAAVLHELSAPFRLETLALEEPADDEILVKIVCAGICHTDIKVSKGYASVPLPVVLGHEGAGVVEQTGKSVTIVAPGDHVLLTFDSCGDCLQCNARHPAYCDNGQTLSFSCLGRHSPSPLTLNGERVYGSFFGQSSFASHVISNERNTVKVDKDLPLKKLGPLGCGFQTGAGAILNVLQPATGQSLAIFGGGNVGLSAVMAAVISKLDPIIVVDNNTDRLAMALKLGASHVIDAGKEAEIVAQINRITGNRGVNYSVDTTNIPALVRQAFESLANRGSCIHSGGGGKDLTFPGSHLLHGRSVQGVIQGDSDPQVFIPQLLDYYRKGLFPFDKLLSFYPLAEINRAVADMTAGQVIKPVLQMP